MAFPFTKAWREQRRQKSLLDPYPESAVARDPWQFWQRGYDRDATYTGVCAAAESGFDAYSQSVAQLPIHHVGVDGQSHDIKRNSSVARLLRNPNGYQTRSDFMNQLTRRLMSTGNAYAVAERNNRFEVVGLHPVYASHCEPYIDRDTGTWYYNVSHNELAPFEDGVLIPARDILHIKLYTPYHPLKGISPISYAANSKAANVALTGHAASFFNNMARPSFILSTDMQLTQAQMTSLRQAWAEQSKHLNSGGVPILAGGLKAQQLGVSTQDAQLVEAFKMTVEDIGRALRIPLPMMGIETTYASTEQLIGFWLSSGLGFVLNHIEQSLAKFLGLPATESIEFDTDALLRTDFQGRVDGVTKGILGGLFSPDEGRAKFNLPKVKDGFGEEPRVQQQVVPLSQVGQMPEAPPAPEAPPSVPPANDEADAEVSRALVVDMIQRKKLQ